MQTPFLIGDKIYLRPLERADSALAQAWLNDPEVTRTLRRYWPISLRAEEDYIESIQKSEHDLALVIVLKAGDRPIGLAGLHQIDFKDRHAEFGIGIGDKGEWGKGYGTETTRLLVDFAFATLNLNRVHLHVYANNPRGERCYEKVGFRKEGVLRQHCYREGRYWDSTCMAILREEWERARS
jgi:RimJ/RimL family protein N-acetyltransferase